MTAPAPIREAADEHARQEREDRRFRRNFWIVASVMLAAFWTCAIAGCVSVWPRTVFPAAALAAIEGE